MGVTVAVNITVRASETCQVSPVVRRIAKHTEKTRDNAEYETVKAATERTKEILDCIDKQVAEQQNRLRLAEIQSNLDTSGLDKMGSGHPIFLEYRNLDLMNHSLIHDGSLTMKLGDTKRVKSLHVVLLEDCMMLLQKQGDKYLLKFHSSTAGQAAGKEESRRLFHSPIIKFSTMLVRPVATDKRAFYLLNTTERGPQIYELLANSAAEEVNGSNISQRPPMHTNAGTECRKRSLTPSSWVQV